MTLQNIHWDPWQKEFLKVKGNKILCTGRQVGKSTICAKDAGDYALTHNNKTILMIAPTERQAYELFDKTINYILSKRNKSIIKSPLNTNLTKTKCVLKSGTRILCLPSGTSGSGIRGYTIHRLYADEASRIPDEVWTAVTPMLLTTAGSIIMLSTPWGKQGYFWETWEKDESFHKFHIISEKVIKEREICLSWSEAQQKAALDFLEQEKRRKTKLQYGQEYLGLFVDDLMRLFTDELLKDRCIKRASEIRREECKYYLGVDVARSGGDETVFSIVEKTPDNKLIQKQNIIAVNNMITETAREIIHLNRKWRFAKIYIDTGGMGVGVFDILLEHPETKRHVVSIDNATRPIEDSKLVKTSNKVKEKDPKQTSLLKNDLYNNLIVLMEQKIITLLDDPELIQSLRSIQLEYTDMGNLRITGRYDHCAESLIRAAWCIKDKSLKLYVY